MDRRRVAAVVLVLVAATLVASAIHGPERPDASGDPPGDGLVQPRDGGDYLWPYTSRQRDVGSRTLALNVVVLGDADRVERILANRTSANWTRTDVETPLTESPWRRAHGSPRYTYLAPSTREPGRWKRADYQLGVGSYLGRQIHARAYASPYGDATALQVHTEYWDWFRMRHTVTGLSPASSFVERDLRSTRATADVRREYVGLTGKRTDGSLSVVELLAVVQGAGVGLATAAVGRRGRRERAADAVRDLALPVALAGVVLGVRAAGVGAESLLPAVDPKYFGVVLYPALAAGPIVAVRRLAPGRPPAIAALGAAGGLGAGLALDLLVIGVRAVPVDLALHRVSLVGCLAVLALGASWADRRVTALGLAAWVCTLALPLAGVV